MLLFILLLLVIIRWTK